MHLVSPLGVSLVAILEQTDDLEVPGLRRSHEVRVPLDIDDRFLPDGNRKRDRSIPDVTCQLDCPLFTLRESIAQRLALFSAIKPFDKRPVHQSNSLMGLPSWWIMEIGRPEGWTYCKSWSIPSTWKQVAIKSSGRIGRSRG